MNLRRYALKMARRMPGVLKPCKRCQTFGGHFDGFDFQECAECLGEGQVAS